MQTRRSTKKLPSIHLTEVRSNSTCHSLKLPLALACDRCESKIDVTLFARKSRKKKEIFREMVLPTILGRQVDKLYVSHYNKNYIIQ